MPGPSRASPFASRANSPSRSTSLSFDLPVAYVYNPLVYARRGFEHYVERYARRGAEVLLVGMNPGPFGMAQTGVPFGDVSMVRDWLAIEERVERPAHEHPRRPDRGLLLPAVRGERDASVGVGTRSVRLTRTILRALLRGQLVSARSSSRNPAVIARPTSCPRSSDDVSSSCATTRSYVSCAGWSRVSSSVWAASRRSERDPRSARADRGSARSCIPAPRARWRTGAGLLRRKAQLRELGIDL